MTLGALAKILPPPARPRETKRSPAHWDALERARRFVETYGTGSISRFITIANPFSGNDPYLPWLTQVIAADKNSLGFDGKARPGSRGSTCARTR